MGWRFSQSDGALQPVQAFDDATLASVMRARIYPDAVPWPMQQYRFPGLGRIFDDDWAWDIRGGPPRFPMAESPSTCHSSDSEETTSQKRRFHLDIARVRRLCAKWKRIARARALARKLLACELLPEAVRLEVVSQTIARYL